MLALLLLCTELIIHSSSLQLTLEELDSALETLELILGNGFPSKDLAVYQGGALMASFNQKDDRWTDNFLKDYKRKKARGKRDQPWGAVATACTSLKAYLKSRKNMYYMESR